MGESGRPDSSELQCLPMGSQVVRLWDQEGRIHPRAPGNTTLETSAPIVNRAGYHVAFNDSGFAS